MAVPRSHSSKQRKRTRRSSVWKLDAPTLVRCKECKEFTVPHRVCRGCGFYRGRAVVVKQSTRA